MTGIRQDGRRDGQMDDNGMKEHLQNLQFGEIECTSVRTVPLGACDRDANLMRVGCAYVTEMHRDCAERSGEPENRPMRQTEERSRGRS